jgi:hypothetical protein
MKITKFSRLTFGLVLFCFSSFGQIIVPGSEDVLAKMRLNRSMDGDKEVTYANISGNPFMFRDFKPGKLILKSGEEFNLEFRYDVYADQMHMKDKNAVYGLIHPEKVAKIIIDSVKFVYEEFANKGNEITKSNGGFFILRVDGKCSLLVRKNIRIQYPELPKPYQPAKPARFINTADTYYLKTHDKNAIKISGRNVLLSVLSDRKNEISRFIRENRLKLKDEEDLFRLISYYNKL